MNLAGLSQGVAGQENVGEAVAVPGVPRLHPYLERERVL